MTLHIWKNGGSTEACPTQSLDPWLLHSCFSVAQIVEFALGPNSPQKFCFCFSFPELSCLVSPYISFTPNVSHHRFLLLCMDFLCPVSLLKSQSLLQAAISTFPALSQSSFGLQRPCLLQLSQLVHQPEHLSTFLGKACLGRLWNGISVKVTEGHWHTYA